MENIRQTLLARFNVTACQPGNAVIHSAIISEIQSISGVLSVDIEALHLKGDHPAIASALKAHKARWDARQRCIIPAEQLVLDDDMLTLKQDSANG